MQSEVNRHPSGHSYLRRIVPLTAAVSVPCYEHHSSFGALLQHHSSVGPLLLALRSVGPLLQHHSSVSPLLLALRSVSP